MPEMLTVGDRQIAVERRAGRAPGLFWLSGFRSDMTGSKALAVDAYGASHGLAATRFDYSGHGRSGGDFAQGTISRWLEEAEAVFATTRGPQIVIGSSMGGWLALHVALLRKDRVRALIGIAAAPDFTDWCFSDGLKARLGAGETLRGKGDYGERVTTPGFWSSGQEMRLLGGEIAVDCPVRLIHGERDPDVPLEIAFRTMRALRSSDVQVAVIKGGGHRLSEPHEIATILRTVGGLLEPPE